MYNPGTIASHLNRLRWLTFPAINAECIALLLAAIIKDAVTINWENFIESTSFTDLVIDKITNRYHK